MKIGIRYLCILLVAILALASVVDSFQFKSGSVKVGTEAPKKFSPSSPVSVFVPQEEKIQVYLSLTGTKMPQAAFLYFEEVESVEGKPVIATFAPDVDENAIAFSLNPAALAKETFHYHSGMYRAFILVGDGREEKGTSPLNIVVGDFDMKFRKPAQKLEETVYEETDKPLVHTFATPEVRPPKAVSISVALVVVGLFDLLIIALLVWRVNVGNLSGKIVPYSLVFHLSVLGLLMIIVHYWLSLTFFGAMKYLFGMGIISFVSGYHMLKQLPVTGN